MRMLKYNGVEKSIREWAEGSGVCASTIRRRLQRGGTIDSILMDPPQSNNQHSKNRSNKWVKGSFKALTIYGKAITVVGLLKGIWAIYESKRAILIHIPTMKRVSYLGSVVSIEKLKYMADQLTPMFPGGNLPTDKRDILSIAKVVQNI